MGAGLVGMLLVGRAPSRWWAQPPVWTATETPGLGGPNVQRESLVTCGSLAGTVGLPAGWHSWALGTALGLPGEGRGWSPWLEGSGKTEISPGPR